MVLALVLIAFLVAMIATSTLGPARLESRLDGMDQSQRDETLRSIPRATRPSFPLAAATIAAVAAGVNVALGRSGAPWWALASVLSIGLLASQRRARPRLERVLLDAGARPPDRDDTDFERRQRRWSYAGTSLFTVGTCCRILARLDGAAWLVVPGALLVLASFVVLLVAGWMLLRGPDPEPIVLWHRGD